MDERDGSQQWSPRQQSLLSELETIFFAHGFRAMTMDRLANLLRCSKRDLYALAPSRKDLFLLILHRWAARVQTSGEAAASANVDPTQKLAAYLEPGVRETAGIAPKFLTDLNDFPPAKAILDAHQVKRMAGLRDIVDDGAGDGTFRRFNATLVAGAALAAVGKIDDPQFLASAGLTFSEAFDELYRLLMVGLQNEDTTQTKSSKG